MTTMNKTMELVGVAEIAEEFGVGRSVVSMWDARRSSNGFPQPVVRLSMGPVFRADQVRDWWSAKGLGKESVSG